MTLEVNDYASSLLVMELELWSFDNQCYVFPLTNLIQ